MAIKVSVSTAAPLKIQVQNETAKMVPADLRIGSVIKGLDGKSAYQIAVENGFKGTESEWLKSLEGGAGYSPSVHLERKENGVLITAKNQGGQESQMVYDGEGGGVDFTTDETLTLKNGVLSVNTTDAAVSDDPRPITAQGVYNEFAVLNALLKTI